MRRAGKGQLVEDKKKDVIKLLKRLDILNQADKALPLVPLPHPVRNGWERYFVVREDVRKGPHGKFLERLLNKINTTEFCKTKDFKRLNWKTRKMEPIQQHLAYLDEKEFEKLDAREKTAFNKERRLFKYWFTQEYRDVWVVTKPWQFVFRIRPSFLTHEKVVNGDIESEIKKIREKLYTYRDWYKYMDHSSNPHDYDTTAKAMIREKIAKKEVKEWNQE